MPMLPQLITALVILANPATPQVLGDSSMPAVAQIQATTVPVAKTLASHDLPLNDRYGNEFVNDVFKDNILLTMHYLMGNIKSKADIGLNDIEKPFHFEFSLNPNERFVFHDNMLSEYKDNVVKTTKAHFNFQDGFKSDGYLTGDGVCHLASLIHWVAKDADIESIAPTNHDFAIIPDVPKEYGVAIYQGPGTGENQNLYIKNTKDKPIKFVFNYKNSILNFAIEEIN